jgi:antitoxin CcdA
MLLSACFPRDASCWSSFRHPAAVLQRLRQTLASLASCAMCLLGLGNVHESGRTVPSTVGSVRGASTSRPGKLRSGKGTAVFGLRTPALCARPGETDTDDVAVPERLAVPAAPRRPTVARSSGSAVTRRSMKITLAVGLVTEARELRVDVSQAAEAGIAAAVLQRRQERWLADNQPALESSNAFVEQHGLPLSRHRAT